MKRIVIDIKTGQVKGNIDVVENDNKSDVYKIYILKNKAIYDLTGKTPRMVMIDKKQNIKQVIDLNIADAKRGEVNLQVSDAWSRRDGRYVCQLAIFGLEGFLEQSTYFWITIKNSLFNYVGGEILADPQFEMLKQELEKFQVAFAKIDEWDKYFEDASGKIEEKYTRRLNDVSSKLYNIEKEKATKTEVEVERKRIDLLTKIESGQTEGNTELLDLRIGEDGVSYDTAGQSVREQFKKTKLQIAEKVNESFDTLIGFDEAILNIDLKENIKIKGFEIGQCTEFNTMDYSVKNRIAIINLKKQIDPKAGDIFELGDFSKYWFALGFNNSTIGWIKDEEGDAYWDKPLVLKEEDIYRTDHILIRRIDNANMTQSDLDYINNHFYYNKSKATIKDKIIGKEQLKDDIAIFLNRKENRHTRVFHLSFDDVSLSLVDLYNNKDKYASIFDNAFFGMLRNFHDKYNCVISCYAYTDDIKYINDNFKQEFFQNSDWLKFGFHCKSGTEDYSLISSDVAKIHYDTFINNIYSMCGTPSSIDRLPRINYFKGSLENLRVFRDCDCGIIGCLSADDSRNTYYFDEKQLSYLRTHDRLNDYENGLIFFSTDIRLDWFVSGFESSHQYDKPTTNVYDELVNRFKNKKYADSFNTLIVFGHEWQVYNPNNTLNNTFKEYIESSLRFALEYKFEFNFPMNYVDVITPKYLNANYFTNKVNLSFEKGAIDNVGNFVSSDTRLLCKNMKFNNIEKLVIKIPSDCKINYMGVDEKGAKTVHGWKDETKTIIYLKPNYTYSFVFAKRSNEIVNIGDIDVNCYSFEKI